MGPFYCPGDHKLYIDLSFYSDLKDRFKAPGDFAQAYVIAHEVGHHVQTLLGISEKVQQSQRGLSEADSNQLSVRMELQADCLAGVWANHAHQSRQLLEEGDIEEGLAAASAIGDDRLQKQSQGYVSPDSFTHGSSAQRVKWFRVGLDRGDISRPVHLRRGKAVAKLANGKVRFRWIEAPCNADTTRSRRIQADNRQKLDAHLKLFFYARFRTDHTYFYAHYDDVSSGN